MVHASTAGNFMITTTITTKTAVKVSVHTQIHTRTHTYTNQTLTIEVTFKNSQLNSELHEVFLGISKVALWSMTWIPSPRKESTDSQRLSSDATLGYIPYPTKIQRNKQNGFSGYAATSTIFKNALQNETADLNLG